MKPRKLIGLLHSYWPTQADDGKALLLPQGQLAARAMFQRSENLSLELGLCKSRKQCPVRPSAKSEVVLCIEDAVIANVSWVSTATTSSCQERHAFRAARLIHLTRICSAYLGALLHAR